MLLFSNGKLVKVSIFDYGDCYMATASTSKCSVWNCYETTRERAKEMALFRLNQALEEESEEKELALEGEHCAVYRKKTALKVPIDKGA
jgi:hypothetical protein